MLIFILLYNIRNYIRVIIINILHLYNPMSRTVFNFCTWANKNEPTDVRYDTVYFSMFYPYKKKKI